jgi:hypothetical protein
MRARPLSFTPIFLPAFPIGLPASPPPALTLSLSKGEGWRQHAGCLTHPSGQTTSMAHGSAALRPSPIWWMDVTDASCQLS